VCRDLVVVCDLVDGNSTPYVDSSDEDESFEEQSGDEVIGKNTSLIGRQKFLYLL
jgi:alpha-galactosidase